jgi:hypothetical protein
VFQSILILVLPPQYALVPAVIFTVVHILDLILKPNGLRTSPYLEGTLGKKFTVMLPNEDGEFEGPGKEKIAVLLLGSKVNHPMGVFAPMMDQFVGWADQLNIALEDMKGQDNGCRLLELQGGHLFIIAFCYD